jgi:Domain of unknown function (DUF4326)
MAKADMMARTTVCNVRHAPPGSYVYVGRRMRSVPFAQGPCLWGNPFRDGDVQEVAERYRAYVLRRPELVALLGSLKGKALGCWCVDDDRNPPCRKGEYQCHAQILAELADAS